jgi:hypothetical protein
MRSGSGWSRLDRAWSRQGSHAACADCTTTFNNAHGIVFPRTALSLASVVRDAGGDPRGGRQGRWRRLSLHVERLSADRWLEVPAWMFDRARCHDPPRLTASPFVSMDALSALSNLLLKALRPPLSSSNAPHSHPDPLTTRIGERLMTRSPVQPPAMPAEQRRLQQSDRSQQIDLFDAVTPT